MWNQIRPAVVSFTLLTVLTGAVYPAVVTLVAKAAFPKQAGGSLIDLAGHTVGSGLIAQSFTGPTYFWPRPSAANYDGAAGSGSNLGPTNPALVDAVRTRVTALRNAGQTADAVVPVDLVTASASGLDPHISPAAAEFQVARVAAARKMPVASVRSLIDHCTEVPTLGVLGEARVNVLELNLLLDRGEAQAVALFGTRGRAFLPSTH